MVAKLVKYHFSRTFAQCGKYDQNWRFPLFCSGLQICSNTTLFSILLRMANMVKILVFRTFLHFSKVGQISIFPYLCSVWQILPKRSFPYFCSGKQSWLKYHFFKRFAQDSKFDQKIIIHMFLIFIWYHKLITDNLDTNKNSRIK